MHTEPSGGTATHTDLRRAHSRTSGETCGSPAAQSCPVCYPSKTRVFQQNPSVQQAQLDAALDSDAINAAAQSSIHLLGGFFSVCRDLVALRRNPIRSIASRDPIAENHEKSMVFIEFLDDATRSSQTEKITPSKCIEASAANFIAPEHA